MPAGQKQRKHVTGVNLGCEVQRNDLGGTCKSSRDFLTQICSCFSLQAPACAVVLGHLCPGVQDTVNTWGRYDDFVSARLSITCTAPVPAMQSSAAQHHHVSIAALHVVGDRRPHPTGTAIRCQGCGFYMVCLHLQPQHKKHTASFNTLSVPASLSGCPGRTDPNEHA